MALDPDLLERAKSAGATFADAERESLLRRADYHAAVRRLHLAGASLREIAHALSLSHQRVQQIVRSAGGSWWRRVWRTRNVRPDAICTWCERSPAEVAKLIAGPKVYLCDACIASAERLVAGRPAAGPFVRLTWKGLAATCAFCGRRAGQQRPLAAGRGGHVCAECLTLCRDILDSRPT
jgi:hypothetical protein